MTPVHLSLDQERLYQIFADPVLAKELSQPVKCLPQPGEEIYLVNGEYVSMRSASGTPVVSAHVIFEEL